MQQQFDQRVRRARELDAAMQCEFERRRRLDIDDAYHYSEMAELHDMAGEPLPWSKAFGIACLIAAGMILASMIYLN